jgi:hypothetical protein
MADMQERLKEQTKPSFYRRTPENYLHLYQGQNNSGENLFHYLLSVLPTSKACRECRQKILTILTSYCTSAKTSNERQKTDLDKTTAWRGSETQEERSKEDLHLRREHITNLLHLLTKETLHTCAKTRSSATAEETEDANGRNGGLKRCAAPLPVDPALFARATGALLQPPKKTRTRRSSETSTEPPHKNADPQTTIKPWNT